MPQLHNVVLIVLSAGMAGSAIYWARQGRYNFWGNAYKPSETEMGLTIYVFYMSKFYEFFDTVCPASSCLARPCSPMLRRISNVAHSSDLRTDFQRSSKISAPDHCIFAE